MRRGKQKNSVKKKEVKGRKMQLLNCMELSLYIQRKAWVVNLNGVWSIHVSILFRRSFHRIIPLFLAS